MEARTRLSALAAHLTIQARLGQIFDANTISDIYVLVLCVLSNGDDSAHALVAADQGQLRWVRHLSIPDGQVGVADS